MDYFNKTEDDIWCRSQLDALAALDDRIHISYVLSSAAPNLSPSPSTSTGTAPAKMINGRIHFGRISAELVARFSNKDSDTFATFCCVCGPTPFNELCLSFLRETQFDDENLHIFHG